MARMFSGVGLRRATWLRGCWQGAVFRGVCFLVWLCLPFGRGGSAILGM